MKRTKFKRMIRRVIILFVIAIIFFIFSGYSLSEDFTICTYRITSEKLSNTEPIRIVLIADLHDHSFGGDQQPLVSAIQDAKPDLILLVGDMFNTIPDDRGAEQLLQGIRGVAPIFYVTGNHEIASGRQEAIETIQKYGVTVLESTQRCLSIDGQIIQVIGIDDPLYHGNKTMEQVLEPISGFDASCFSILLSHRPEYIEKFSEREFDLVVSGHTHGGQIRIPFLVNGLYAHGQGWLPKYAGGLYNVSNTTLIISRGLGNESKIPRVFNPRELVVIDLYCGD